MSGGPYYKCGCVDWITPRMFGENTRQWRRRADRVGIEATMESDARGEGQDIRSKLIMASRSGDIALVRQLVKDGAHTYLNYALWAACYNDQPEMARNLIQMGAWGIERALYAACQGGSIACIELALEYGATDLNLGLSGGCGCDKDEIVKLMIREGATECHNCRHPIDAHPVGYSDDNGVKDPRAVGWCPLCGGDVYMHPVESDGEDDEDDEGIDDVD